MVKGGCLARVFFGWVLTLVVFDVVLLVEDDFSVIGLGLIVLDTMIYVDVLVIIDWLGF